MTGVQTCALPIFRVDDRHSDDQQPQDGSGRARACDEETLIAAHHNTTLSGIAAIFPRRARPVVIDSQAGDAPQRSRLRARREASTIEANCGGSMIGQLRQGDMLVRSASAATIRNAPTAAAADRVATPSESRAAAAGWVLPGPAPALR